MSLLKLILIVAVAHNALAEPMTNFDEYIKKYKDLSINEQQSTSQDLHLTLDANITYEVESYSIDEDHEVNLHLETDSISGPMRTRRQVRAGGSYLYFANVVHLVLLQNVPSLRITTYRGGFNRVAVDFDKRDRLIFWSDVRLRRIYQAFENGTGSQVLVRTGITVPDGIAWDWVNKKLYWTDAGDRDLEVLDPRTGFRRVIFRFGIRTRPRAIIVDPSTRYMYWSDWGSPAKIERASMDGTSRTVLHNTRLFWPNAMTLDYNTQTLYWMDARLNRMERSNADGSNRRLLSTRFIRHPFGMAFYNGDLFWSDWQLKAILAAPANRPSNVRVVFGNLRRNPMGVTIVSLARQRAVFNRCRNRCTLSASCLLRRSFPYYSCQARSFGLPRLG